MNRIRQILPVPILLIWLAVVVILLSLRPVSESASMFLFGMMVFTPIAYAMYRVYYFHPGFNRKYRQWLSIIPWTPSKPLPLGPVHLTWVDGVVLLLHCLVLFLGYSGYLSGGAVTFVDVVVSLAPAFLFFCMYLFLLWAGMFWGGQFGIMLLVLAITPFALWPFPYGQMIPVVLLVNYLLLSYGVKRSLRIFPWQYDEYRSDPLQEQIRKSFTQRILPWPQISLNYFEWAKVHVSVPLAVVIGGIVVWWHYVISWRTGDELAPGYVLVVVMVIAIVRLFIYCGAYWPPISLLGRLSTGRWILWGYDKALVAPVLIALLGFAAADIARLLQCPYPPVGLATLFLALFLGLTLPPSLHPWRLTGHYRLANLTALQGSPARKRTENDPLQNLCSHLR